VTAFRFESPQRLKTERSNWVGDNLVEELRERLPERLNFVDFSAQAPHLVIAE